MIGWGLDSGGSVITTERLVQSVAPCAGTIKKLRIQAFSDPGASKTITVKLRVNGADSALTVAITGTTRYGEDLSTNVSVSAGDLLCFSLVPTGSPTDETRLTVSAIFEGSGNDFPILGSMPSGWPGGTDSFIGGYGHQPLSSGDSSQDNSEKFYCPIAGTITAFYIHGNVTQDLGSCIFQIVRNTTVETSSNITIPNGTGDQSGNVTGLSIAVSAGDTISIKADVTTSLTTTLKWGIAFTPTTPGQNFLSYAYLPSTANVATFAAPGWTGSFTQTTEYPYPLPACTIKNPFADVSTAPGTGNTWDIDVRTGSTVGGMANGNSHLDIDGTGTSDSDTTSDAYTDGMFFSVSVTSGSTPTSVGDAMRIAFIVEFAAGSVTATIASLLDELTASLNVNQSDFVTITSNVDEVTASLNVYMAPSPNINAVLDELQAALAVNQTQQVTIASVLDELTCSITLDMAPTVTVAASVDEVVASLNLDQSTPVSLTIASTLDELQAAMSVGQRDDVTIASLLDELTASLNVNQAQQVTIGATVDELTTSLSLDQRILMTIASVIDEAAASLNAEQRYLLTIGATLDEVTANLTLEQRILLSVASALDELQASVNAQQTQQVTLSASVDEIAASLSLEQQVLMTVVSVIDEAVGSFAVNQTNVLTIEALLDELTASLDVSLLNFIFPELGKILMALDRNETLFALRGLDATETLMALARDDTLFALQGYDGVETLRALDRDEALNPLEART